MRDCRKKVNVEKKRLDDHLQGVVLLVILLTFFNSSVMLVVSILLLIGISHLRRTCEELRVFIRRRFTQTIDKI